MGYEEKYFIWSGRSIAEAPSKRQVNKKNPLYGVALPQGFSYNKVVVFILFHISCVVIVFRYIWYYCGILYSDLWYLTSGIRALSVGLLRGGVNQ
jgi:hypothetical protein